LFERILVPLDGSETAEAALAYVALLPSERVRLLAVESDRANLTAVCTTARDCRTYLEAVAAPLREQGRAVDTVVVFGSPAEQILALAAAADLVVMGSHGHGGARRFVLGSVADEVARHAPVPVMIVRGASKSSSAPAVQVTRIVVPLDGSELAEQAVAMAAAVADDLGVPVHLMRVLDVDALRATVQAGIHAAAAYLRSQEEIQRYAEEYLAEQVQQLRNRDLTATAEVLTGSPAVTLLDAMRPDDLVVMTTHGRGGVRRMLLGSVADKLVRAAAAPVLLVRANGPESAAPDEEPHGSAGVSI
jgi:nucleotide-binding universal stress UspA family protein